MAGAKQFSPTTAFDPESGADNPGGGIVALPDAFTTLTSPRILREAAVTLAADLNVNVNVETLINDNTGNTNPADPAVWQTYSQPGPYAGKESEYYFYQGTNGKNLPNLPHTIPAGTTVTSWVWILGNGGSKNVVQSGVGFSNPIIGVIRTSADFQASTPAVGDLSLYTYGTTPAGWDDQGGIQDIFFGTPDPYLAENVTDIVSAKFMAKNRTRAFRVLTLGAGGSASGASYGLNDQARGTINVPESPGQVLIADYNTLMMDRVYDNILEDPHDDTDLEEIDSVEFDPQLALRHNNRGNVLFRDGHVETREPEFFDVYLINSGNPDDTFYAFPWTLGMTN